MPKTYHVDAFAEKPFEGNPAGVCLLDEDKPTEWMQSVATEMNLSATAFIRSGDGAYDLRWFTPVNEIQLCGHGTLASAHICGVKVSSQMVSRFVFRRKAER